MSAALAVRDLRVEVEADGGRAPVVDGISFAVARGEALGVVGESGSGKSMALRAVAGLLPRAARVTGGAVLLGGSEVPASGRGAAAARRGRVAMVFQDASSALDPVRTVGAQIEEVARHVGGHDRRGARERTLELLDLVGIRDGAARVRSHPHELSGGMRQRVALACALAAEPDVLLCDEPTTALDVTVQAQVLALVDDLRRRLELAVVFVSHDVAVVRQVCDRLHVMYAGRIVEEGPTPRLLDEPRHPYTDGLIRAVIDLDDDEPSRAIPGTMPAPGDRPAGCAMHPRCPLATARCTAEDPPLLDVGPDRRSACWHHEELAA